MRDESNEKVSRANVQSLTRSLSAIPLAKPIDIALNGAYTLYLRVQRLQVIAGRGKPADYRS